MNTTTICEAIHHHKVLELDYKGGKRLVEPFIHGINSLGHEVLCAYQVSGYSESGKMGWKMFFIEDVASAHLSEVTFITRFDCETAAERLQEVHCHA